MRVTFLYHWNVVHDLCSLIMLSNFPIQIEPFMSSPTQGEPIHMTLDCAIWHFNNSCHFICRQIICFELPTRCRRLY